MLTTWYVLWTPNDAEHAALYLVLGFLLALGSDCYALPTNQGLQADMYEHAECVSAGTSTGSGDGVDEAERKYGARSYDPAVHCA